MLCMLLSFAFAFDSPADPDDVPAEAEVPVMAIRNTVIFPVLAFPINVGRPQSVSALEAALAGDKLIAVIAQPDPEVVEPTPDELYAMGSLVKVLKSVKVPGNKHNVIIQGVARFEVVSWMSHDDHLMARVKTLPQDNDADPKRVKRLKERASTFIQLDPQIPEEALFLVRSLDEAGVLVDVVASNLQLDVQSKQALFEITDVDARIDATVRHLDQMIRDVKAGKKAPER